MPFIETGSPNVVVAFAWRFALNPSAQDFQFQLPLPVARLCDSKDTGEQDDAQNRSKEETSHDRGPRVATDCADATP